MQYYLDDSVTNETLVKYLSQKFSPHTTGSGAEITFAENGIIQYLDANGDLITLEMGENGQVDITGRADGSTITRTVAYNANGGIGNVPETQTVERKATVNVDFSTLPTKEGYTFLGWATTASAETAQYTQTGTTSFTIGTGNVTLYAVWQDTLIGSDNYGDIANYSTSNGVNDWKVFLNDGTNIYLIASDYVPRSKLSLTSDVVAGAGDYCVAGNSRDGLVSWLATTSNWSNFANGTSGENSMTGATATGGPTLDQFVKSYNAKYGTEYTSDLGQSNWNLSNKTDPLYVSHTSSWNSANAYWLASPRSDNTVNVWLVDYYAAVGSNYYYHMNLAVRPLVCLPAGINAAKGTDGKWTFTN